jgi:hypothetical protein
MNNRWFVEARRYAIFSSDLEFMRGVAASQTGAASFRETHLISPKEIKRRIMSAVKRADERRRIEILREDE